MAMGVKPAVAIVGAGRVGTALGILLHRRGYPILGVVRRSLKAAEESVRLIGDGTPAPADALAVLNRTLQAADNAVVLGTAGEPRPLLVPHVPDADGPLAAVAQSAFELLTGADASRIHRCANGRCVLLFYDTTRSATRRWCSTACMNRARSSRRHRERRQAAAAGEMAPPPPPLP